MVNDIGGGSTVPTFDGGVSAAESALAVSGVLQIVGLTKRYGGVVGA